MAPAAPHWVVIVSPVSGKKTGLAVAQDQLAPELRRAGVAADVVATRHAGHAVDLARDAAGRGHGVIAVGGDGTINEVIRGVLEAGKLGTTPLAILSQGTMNFYGVCAGLPLTPRELAERVAAGDVRPSSLLRVTEPGSGAGFRTSFEALHIGPMAYRVCKGASDWRMTLGPMFGIFLNLILGNALPHSNHHVGTLTIYPKDGGSPVVKKDAFFWIIVTHRNPWNGAVGKDMWVSWMTLDKFPGFGRMMEFFEPQMEHFTGTSRCFGNHALASRVEFTLDAADARPNVNLVLDGDAVPAGKTVVVENMLAAIPLVASPDFPVAVDPKKQTPKSLTPAGAAWLRMYPAPKHLVFPKPKEDAVAAKSGGGGGGKLAALALVVVAVWWWRRSRSG